jgi:hypothetical protein
MYRTLGLR